MEELNKQSRIIEAELLDRLFVGGVAHKVIARLSSEDLFYYKKEFEVITKTELEGGNVQAAIIKNKINVSNFIGKGTFRPIEKVCEDIIKLSKTRRLVAVLEKKDFDHENIDNHIAELQKTLSTTLSGNAIELSDVQSIVSQFKEKQEFYKNKFKDGKGIIGIPTGYDKIDAVIDGFRPEHLWILGGYTNHGKTAASLNFCANLIMQGKRVCYFTLEMSKVDILSRLVGIMTKQSGLTILKGFEHDEGAVEEAMKRLAESKMSIYSERNELTNIESVMLEEHTKNPVDLFVIDFLQLVLVKGARREYETVTNAITGIQKMAKKTKVPIMVLSQISNEGAKTKDDVVMSFKGSGGIAAAADLAIEINIGEEDRKAWKEKISEGEEVEMIWNIRKNRHGKVGSIDMFFDGRTGVFRYDDF